MRSEGLEEEERFKGRVRRQRRHPPLPARSATGGGELGDGGHGEEFGYIKKKEIWMVSKYGDAKKTN